MRAIRWTRRTITIAILLGLCACAGIVGALAPKQPAPATTQTSLQVAATDVPASTVGATASAVTPTVEASKPTEAPPARPTATEKPVVPPPTPVLAQATEEPTEPAASSGTAVEITKKPGTVARNAYAHLTAHAQPATSCSITVRYSSGVSKAEGLDDKIADAKGNVSWQWQVGRTTKAGSWPVTVRCGEASAETEVTVP